MTIQTAKSLASDLLNAGVQVTVIPGTSQVSADWKVIAQAPVGVTVDAAQVSALETRYSVTAPVPTTITFA